jgi:hypothetical protein
MISDINNKDGSVIARSSMTETVSSPRPFSRNGLNASRHREEGDVLRMPSFDRARDQYLEKLIRLGQTLAYEAVPTSHLPEYASAGLGVYSNRGSAAAEMKDNILTSSIDPSHVRISLPNEFLEERDQVVYIITTFDERLVIGSQPLIRYRYCGLSSFLGQTQNDSARSR